MMGIDPMNILLFNPNAGMARRLGLTEDNLLSRLKSKGIEVESICCGDGEEMARTAAETDGMAIVAGGDGTIHSLLQAVNRCNALRIAIIPCGTANHLATALDIPQNIDDAINIMASGQIKAIDIGSVNGTMFIQAAGVGLHARIFHQYGEHKEKSSIDAAAATLSVFSGWEPKSMKITIDGSSSVEEVTQVTVANTPMYGGRFLIAPEARLDDGLFDVVILGSMSKMEIIEYAVSAMTGALAGKPKTSIFRAKSIDIESLSGPVEVHADAQPAGFTPKSIRILSDCVEVVVP